MKNKLLMAFEARVFASRKKHPTFRSGDTVRISYKVQEGADKAKFRTQMFEGVVIRNHKGGVAATFTVRKISANGVGVERTFPLYSPYIDKIDVLANGVVRRSRLFYLRDLSGKSARIRSRFHGRKAMIVVPGSENTAEEVVPELAPLTESEKAKEAKAAAAAAAKAEAAKKA